MKYLILYLSPFDIDFLKRDGKTEFQRYQRHNVLKTISKKIN